MRRNSGKARPDAEEQSWSEWMAAAQGGDRAAYQRLLESVLPRLRGFVTNRLGDPASVEDVVQNVLFNLHRARHTYRPERPFGPWLWAIGRNAVIDAQRARSRRLRREVPLESVAEPVQPESDPVDVPTLSPELAEALQKLPASQREAVELVRLQGLSVAEAAQRVGISPGALKVRAHRGYRALRARLTGGKP